jgi:hypothetical protein
MIEVVGALIRRDGKFLLPKDPARFLIRNGNFLAGKLREERPMKMPSAGKSRKNLALQFQSKRR